MFIHLIACSQTEYKLTIGNSACQKCGNNSLNTGNKLCRCKEYYYRRVDEENDNQKDCYHVRTFGKKHLKFNYFIIHT